MPALPVTAGINSTFHTRSSRRGSTPLFTQALTGRALAGASPSLPQRHYHDHHDNHHQHAHHNRERDHGTASGRSGCDRLGNRRQHSVWNRSAHHHPRILAGTFFVRSRRGGFWQPRFLIPRAPKQSRRAPQRQQPRLRVRPGSRARLRTEYASEFRRSLKRPAFRRRVSSRPGLLFFDVNRFARRSRSKQACELTGVFGSRGRSRRTRGRLSRRAEHLREFVGLCRRRRF